MSHGGEGEEWRDVTRFAGVESPDCVIVISPRTIALGVALGALGLSGCASESSSASGEQPLPTIGLGTDFDPAVISGAADVRAVGAADVDTVVMIGDSITRAATPALEEQFRALGVEVFIEAQNSKRMALTFGDNPSGADIARFLTTAGDDTGGDDGGNDGGRANELWIVALGTNDVGQYSSPDQMAAAVNEVLDAVPEESPLIWVDVFFRDRGDDAEVLNAIITDRIERRGNAVVAPWTWVVAGDGVLQGDGVHPTNFGEEVFAGVVVATAAEFLGR